MLPITSLFAAVFAIAIVALALPVSLRRLSVGDMIGDSPEERLKRRIRAHGNFAEYVPLSLIVLGLSEARGAPAWAVLTLGGLLAVGRLLHAIGMYRASTSLRGVGIVSTYVTLLGAAGFLFADSALL